MRVKDSVKVFRPLGLKYAADACLGRQTVPLRRPSAARAAQLAPPPMAAAAAAAAWTVALAAPLRQAAETRPPVQWRRCVRLHMQWQQNRGSRRLR